MTIDQLVKGYSARLIFLAMIFFSVLSGLVFRLWYEQVRLGVNHRNAISKQSVRRIRIPPVRGRVYSGDGKLFTDNVPVYDALFHIHEIRQAGRYGFNKTASVLEKHLHHTAEIIQREFDAHLDVLNRHIRVYPALPFTAFKDLNEMELARLFETIPRIRGLEVATRMKRVYPMGSVGAQIIGFVGKKDPNLEEDRDSYSYFLPELTGRTGLEKIFEEKLKGKGGGKLIQVDSMGFFYDEITKTDPPDPGHDIILTIDSRAQRIAQQLLKNRKGAIVLVDCNSGAVLAAVSSPTYDLNNLTASRYAELAADDLNLPLLNRSLATGYSPGSIIKPIIGMAILNEKVLSADSTYNCTGSYPIGDTQIRCSSSDGHGEVNLVKALETSCNSYFIHAGIEMGVDRLSAYLANAGIGQDTGFEIKPSGFAGVLPGRGEKRKRTGRFWTTFDTALISIGQGLITLSPMQAAVYTAAIANGGVIYRTSVIRAIKDAHGFYTYVRKPEVRGKLWVSPQILQTTRKGMIAVVHGKHATGVQAQTPVIRLAGKTGTAEVGSGRNKKKNTWFICYGPVDSPRYAMSMLVENAVSGGVSAAPLAKQFFDRYLIEKRYQSNGGQTDGQLSRQDQFVTQN